MSQSAHYLILIKANTGEIMDKVNLKASLRTDFSKSGRSELRRKGGVPGIYYSKQGEPIAIEVPENSINPLVFTSESHLINLQLDNGSELECIIKDIQFDPVTDKVVHFDLLGLLSGETVQMEVPVVLHGSAVGIKEGGQLQQLLHKLEIKCLPKDLPQHIDIDVTELHLGDTLHVENLNLENITILNPADAVIVAITRPRTDKEAMEGEEEEPKEPEIILKGKAEKEE
jgi:large subunit ribosomal protein L25